LDMPPIDEDEYKRSILAGGQNPTNRDEEKLPILSVGHFAGSKGEFVMMDFASPADVTVNAYIPRRIVDRHVGLAPLHQSPVGPRVARITAQKPVSPQQP